MSPLKKYKCFPCICVYDRTVYRGYMSPNLLAWIDNVDQFVNPSDRLTRMPGRCFQNVQKNSSSMRKMNTHHYVRDLNAFPGVDLRRIRLPLNRIGQAIDSSSVYNDQ